MMPEWLEMIAKLFAVMVMTVIWLVTRVFVLQKEVKKLKNKKKYKKETTIEVDDKWRTKDDKLGLNI